MSPRIESNTFIERLTDGGQNNGAVLMARIEVGNPPMHIE